MRTIGQKDFQITILNGKIIDFQFQFVLEARLISLNWKIIIHNKYPTKVLLFKIGKENTNLRNSCNVVDYPEHFFSLSVVKQSPRGF